MSIPPGAAPPHDVRAEQAVLGAMLMSDKVHYAYVIEAGLSVDAFYLPRHQRIFEAMLTLLQGAEPIDVETVIAQLRRAGALEDAGGAAQVDALTAAVPAVGNLRSYASTVSEHHQRRMMLAVSYDLQTSAFDFTTSPRDAIAAAAKRVLDLAAPRGSHGPRRFSAAAEKTAELVAQRMQQGTGLLGPSTGIQALDDVLLGCRPGALYVIGARPSQGKSVLSGQIPEHVARTGDPTRRDDTTGEPAQAASLMFALEMDDHEVAGRLLAATTPIPYANINRGALNAPQMDKFIAAIAKRDTLPMWIDDNADYGLAELMAITRQLYQHTHGALRVVVVDYVQMVRLENTRDSRNDRIGDITTGLKRLARELGITVIVAAQLSRAIENRADPRPTLADLRDSGRIEQDADVVVFIHPVADEDAGGRRDHNTLLIVAKNRNHVKDVDVPVRFLPELQRFDDVV